MVTFKCSYTLLKDLTKGESAGNQKCAEIHKIPEKKCPLVRIPYSRKHNSSNGIQDCAAAAATDNNNKEEKWLYCG